MPCLKTRIDIPTVERNFAIHTMGMLLQCGMW
jgi:hypothetical protein